MSSQGQCLRSPPAPPLFPQDLRASQRLHQLSARDSSGSAGHICDSVGPPPLQRLIPGNRRLPVPERIDAHRRRHVAAGKFPRGGSTDFYRQMTSAANSNKTLIRPPCGGYANHLFCAQIARGHNMLSWMPSGGIFQCREQRDRKENDNAQSLQAGRERTGLRGI